MSTNIEKALETIKEVEDQIVFVDKRIDAKIVSQALRKIKKLLKVPAESKEANESQS